MISALERKRKQRQKVGNAEKEIFLRRDYEQGDGRLAINLKKYNLSLEEYKAKEKEQNNLCAICEKPQTFKTMKRLAVDHCHKLNKFRGLLCGKCNAALGSFGDNPDLLEKAAVYLRKFLVTYPNG